MKNNHSEEQHCAAEEEEIVEFGPFRLYTAGRLLQRNGVTVKLGSRPLDLLIALVRRAGDVLSRRELIARAWAGLVVDEANLRVNISTLRKHLDDGIDGARYIVNLPGRGYSFVAPVTRTRTEPSPTGPALTSEHALPAPLARLVGRDASIRVLSQMLTEHRFVSIIGPGGMGKTTVAIAVAHTMLDAFDGAVYYIDLASVTDASLVPTLLASALSLDVSVQDPKPCILAFFSARRALLVLDNCEHIIDEIACLTEWLYRSAPRTHLLATSREILRVEGEYVHLLPPLDVPPMGQDLTAVEAMTFPAVQLFMDRVAASGTSEQLTNDTARLVVEICRKMDGIALAIELAASRVRSHGLRGTAELIDNRFDLLWQGRRTAPPRHQTLHAMLDWSYNLLSEDERRVLYRLSVFVAPFPLVAAQWVASDASMPQAHVAIIIANLIDKSLISPLIIKGSGQLRLLDSTRAYATPKLAQSGESDAVSRRLAEYLVARLTPATGYQQTWQPTDHDGSTGYNIRPALTWAFSKTGDGELGARLTALAAPHLLKLFLLEECHHWCKAALRHLGSYQGTTTHLILQEAFAISTLFTQPNRDETSVSIESAIELARTLEDHERELGLLAGLHIFMTHVGQFEEAVDISWRSIELARKVGSPEGIVMAEWMLGCAYHLAGDQVRALEHTQKGFKYAAAHGAVKVDLFGFPHRTRALNVLARALWLNGAVDRAAQIAHQAVEEAELNERPVGIFVALVFSATVFLWRGDIDASERLVNQLTEHLNRHSLGPRSALGPALSGEVALLRGDFRLAADLLREGLGTLYTQRLFLLTTALSQSMAVALLECGETVEAEAMILVALERAQARNGSFDMPELLRTRAEVGMACGHLTSNEAQALLRTAMEMANRQGALSLELRAAMALGSLLAREHQAEQAHDLLTEVYNRFTEGHDTRDLKMAKQLINSWCPDEATERDCA